MAVNKVSFIKTLHVSVYTMVRCHNVLVINQKTR